MTARENGGAPTQLFKSMNLLPDETANLRTRGKYYWEKKCFFVLSELPAAINKQAVKLLVKSFRVIYWRLCSLRGTIYTSQASCDGFYNIMLAETQINFVNIVCSVSGLIQPNTFSFLLPQCSLKILDLQKTFVGFLYSLSQWETIWLLNYEANQNSIYI